MQRIASGVFGDYTQTILLSNALGVSLSLSMRDETVEVLQLSFAFYPSGPAACCSAAFLARRSGWKRACPVPVYL